MEITGEFRFESPRQVVWDRLMDSRALQTAIPGCTRFDETAPGTYSVTVKVSLAAITGTYEGTVRLADPRAPEAFRLEVDGSGKAGRVQAAADLTLAESDSGTMLSYRADIRPQGAIARLGNRLIASAGNLLIGQFFKSMEKQILE